LFHKPALRLVARSANPKICLPVVVEEQDVLRVRRALIQSGGGGVEIIRTAHIPGSTRMRLSVRMERLALERTMFAVMNAVDAVEFGRVGPRG
jgi:hypothetical protein